MLIIFFVITESKTFLHAQKQNFDMSKIFFYDNCLVIFNFENADFLFHVVCFTYHRSVIVSNFLNYSLRAMQDNSNNIHYLRL